MPELAAELRRLSGTTLDAQGAANAWAGTTGLALQGALNAKAGTQGLGIQGALNVLAGTSGMGPGGAASLISAAPATLVSDTFTRSDPGNNSLGVATSGQTWVTMFATWGIASNQAAATSNSALTYIDLGAVNNYRVEATVVVGDSGTAVLFRVQDVSNFYMLISGNGLYALYKNVAGSFTALATAPGGNAVNGDRIAVDVRGNSFTAYRNDTQLLVGSDSSFPTGGKVGLRADTFSARFDDFTVKP